MSRGDNCGDTKKSANADVRYNTRKTAKANAYKSS